MIIGLGADVWSFLFIIGQFVPWFLFPLWFLEIMVFVYCLFPWPAQLVCSQGMITVVGTGILE